MSRRNIRKLGDELLRKKSREVEVISPRITDLLDDLAETMYESDGVGLAAPQVGVLRRVAVVDVGEGLLEMINPKIIEESGKQEGQEGCLSVPEYIGSVTRPETVTVRAMNRDGRHFKKTVSGFFARAICHELDHLDGILFVDKATELEKRDAED